MSVSEQNVMTRAAGKPQNATRRLMIPKYRSLRRTSRLLSGRQRASEERDLEA
jgi:hypothetical protein